MAGGVFTYYGGVAQVIDNMAESEGFEPPDGFLSTVFKFAKIALIYKNFFLNHLKR